MRKVGRLIAIAATTTYFAAAEEPTRIFVYAQRDTAARSWLPVSCGETVVAELKQGMFFAINLSPGRYTVGVKGGIPLPVDANPAEESFVRLDWHYQVGQSPIPVLSKVRPEQARKEMLYLSYIDTRRVHSTTVSHSDPRERRRPELKSRGAPE